MLLIGSRAAERTGVGLFRGSLFARRSYARTHHGICGREVVVARTVQNVTPGAGARRHGAWSRAGTVSLPVAVGFRRPGVWVRCGGQDAARVVRDGGVLEWPVVEATGAGVPWASAGCVSDG